MRSNILRQVLGIFGCASIGYALGNMLAWLLAAAMAGVWLQFLCWLITFLLACVATWKVVIPAVVVWAQDSKPLSFPSFAGLKAKFTAA